MKHTRSLLPCVVLAIYWPLLFIITHIPNLRLRELQIYGRDVTLHFLAFLVLTLLYWLVRHGTSRPNPRRSSLYVTVLVLAFYGALDEISQKFINRTSSYIDWLSDLCGVLAALALLFFLRRWLQWLIFYWLSFFLLTHWPKGPSAFVLFAGLTDVWPALRALQQFQVLFVMLGYLVLTFLLWRTLCRQPRFLLNKTIFVATLSVLIPYALLDEFIRFVMQRGFDGANLVGAFVGITTGVLCSATFAQHHLTRDPYGPDQFNPD